MQTAGLHIDNPPVGFADTLPYTRRASLAVCSACYFIAENHLNNLQFIYIKFWLQINIFEFRIDLGSSNCQSKCNSLVEKVNRRNKVKTFSGAIVNQIKNSIKALS